MKAHGNSKGWLSLGPVPFSPQAADKITGAELANVIDRSAGVRFVTAHAERRASSTTIFRVQNRLPFTVANLTVRTGRAEDAGRVSLTGLGLSPARSTTASVPAAVAIVEKVEPTASDQGSPTTYRRMLPGAIAVSRAAL